MMKKVGIFFIPMLCLVLFSQSVIKQETVEAQGGSGGWVTPNSNRATVRKTCRNGAILMTARPESLENSWQITQKTVSGVGVRPYLFVGDAPEPEQQVEISGLLPSGESYSNTFWRPDFSLADPNLRPIAPSQTLYYQPHLMPWEVWGEDRYLYSTFEPIFFNNLLTPETDKVLYDINDQILDIVEDCWIDFTTRISEDAQYFNLNEEFGAPRFDPLDLDSIKPSISADGSTIAFETKTKFDEIEGIVVVDNNNEGDIFTRNWIENTLTPVSIAYEPGSEVIIMGTGRSQNASISSNADQVAFDSTSKNLVEDTQCEDNRNVFLYSPTITHTEKTKQVSCIVNENWAGTSTTSEGASYPSVSNLGVVAYQTNLDLPGALVFDERNTGSDIVAYDGTSNAVSFREHQIDFPGVPPGPILKYTGNSGSYVTDVSNDGLHVAFASDATDLVFNDTNDVTDIFVRYSRAGQSVVNLISLNSAREQANGISLWPSISENGASVAFVSLATNLDPLATEMRFQIYVRDRNLDGDETFDEAIADGDRNTCTMLISKSAEGVAGNDASLAPSISADGRFIAFQSVATNLVDNDTNGATDIFVIDRDPDQDGKFYSDDDCTPGAFGILRASVTHDGSEANGPSGNADISGNGRFVAFDSEADNLVLGDTNEVRDVFVHYIPFENAPIIEIEPPPLPTITLEPPVTLVPSVTIPPIITPEPSGTPAPSVTPDPTETPDPLTRLLPYKSFLPVTVR